MTIGYGQYIPQLKNQLANIQFLTQQYGEARDPSFVEFESDHEILKNLMHLKIDGAFLPVSDFKFFYKQPLVDKLMIYSMPISYEVGFFSGKSCNHTEKNISNLTVYLTKNSPEDKWLQSSIYKKIKTTQLSYYKQLELLNEKRLSCNYLVLGNPKYKRKFQSPEKIHFLSVGSVPVMLLVYDKFISSRNEKINKVLSHFKSQESDKKKIVDQLFKFNEIKSEVKTEILYEFIK